MRAPLFRIHPPEAQNRIPVTIKQPHNSKNMNLLLFISNAFINTMGITQPSPQTAKRAAWFIVALLFAVVILIASVAFLALH